VGYAYDHEADVFIMPKPYDSWSLDSNYDWQPPVAKPGSEGHWVWNEEVGEWQD
jgi:hypothetical protein